ncbi:MAG: type I 3-dehydroquinate dehydratase [Spirochaetales bacterium]
MDDPKICLCLTGSTLAENIATLDMYRNQIDMVELRADYLTADECLYLRRFPQMAGIPTILTLRRIIDGGTFSGGEASRTTVFARGLAFANQDSRKNFAFIDLEEDFNVPSLQDAALAFGIRIIRSHHCMNETVIDIPKKLDSMRKTGYEIPKIACMPSSLADVTKIFQECKSVDYEHIVCAMGVFGLPTRILAKKLGSYLTFCSPPETEGMSDKLGHLDPITLNETYNFRSINNDTEIFGVTGYPLSTTASPRLHNAGYHAHNVNAVYIPIKAKTIDETVDFADEVGIKGISVTVPHKESVIDLLPIVSDQIIEVGACNTLVKTDLGWTGCNTDAAGFKRSLLEFLDKDNFKRKKIAIIGAGGVAKAVAYAVHEMGFHACIFNRTVSKARNLAMIYGFKYAALGLATHELLEQHSWLIIQTTAVGMGAGTHVTSTDDPLEFYDFEGHERVFDVIYYPEKTPMMVRAEKAGCRVCNGYNMLQYQAYEQFELFTGVKYE